MSQAQSAVHWRKEDYYPLSAKCVAPANTSDPAIVERFGEDRFPECFKEHADLFSWDCYWLALFTGAESRRRLFTTSGGTRFGPRTDSGGGLRGIGRAR